MDACIRIAEATQDRDLAANTRLALGGQPGVTIWRGPGRRIRRRWPTTRRIGDRLAPANTCLALAGLALRQDDLAGPDVELSGRAS